MSSVEHVEVLFSNPRRAERARDALCAAPIGEDVQVQVIRDVSTYDHLASFGHSLAYPGAVLGALQAGLSAGLLFLFTVWLFDLRLDLGTLYMCVAVAFSYGGLVGLLMGSQLPAPGPRAMRRGLATGKAVVRVTTNDLPAAMLAHDLLARAPAAERSLTE